MSSDSVARQERRDLCGIDSYPAAVSNQHVGKQERGDPCSCEISEEQLLNKPTKNPKPNKNVDPGQQEFRENLVDDRVPEHTHTPVLLMNHL